MDTSAHFIVDNAPRENDMVLVSFDGGTKAFSFGSG